MGTVHALKRPDGISQSQLRAFYQLEKEYMDAKAKYQAMMARLILLMNAGNRQEAGKYHVEKKTRYIRRISYKEVVIELKGEKYVENLLKHTKAKSYSKLEFSDIGRN